MIDTGGPLTLSQVLNHLNGTGQRMPKSYLAGKGNFYDIPAGGDMGYFLDSPKSPVPEQVFLIDGQWLTLGSDMSGTIIYVPVPADWLPWLENRNVVTATRATYASYSQAFKGPEQSFFGPEFGAMLSMAAMGAGALGAMGFTLSGGLSPMGASAIDAAGSVIETETTTVSMTATEGVSTVGETGLEWYSVDPGPDPFATTDMVNSGWSFDGGYAGVDWYNSAGVGEASAGTSSLADIFGKVTSTIKAAGGAVAAAAGAIQATRNNLAQPAPNYTRAAGGINVGLLAVGLLAWKLL